MPQQLSDEGTRYQHYRELLDLWESTLEAFDSYTTESKTTTERKKQLTAAVTVMQRQLDVLSDFDDNRFYLRRQIDAAHTNTPKEE